MKLSRISIYVCLFFASIIGYSQTNLVGKPVQSVILRDANDNSMAIPNMDKSVVVIFYTDPDEKDVNEPLSNAIKAKNYPKEKYAGVGIGNCADTWLPNSAIRIAARQKEKQYPGSVIMIDSGHILAKTWNLGDCNDKGVVIIIGKDQKVKYLNVVKSQVESSSIISKVLKLIEEEMGK
jgi:predicted transcriptional regulator